MKDLRNIIIVVLALLLWIKQCGYETSEEPEKETVVDTVKVHKIYIDSIPFHYSVPVYTQVPVYKPVHDTLGKTWIYNNPVEDSLISGNIRTVVQDCSMLGQSITYTPKFPKYINRIDSITTTITITNTIEERKIKLLAGVTLTGNSTYFGFSPSIGIKSKNNNVISFGYDLVNKNYMLSLYRAINFKKVK